MQMFYFSIAALADCNSAQAVRTGEVFENPPHHAN